MGRENDPEEELSKGNDENNGVEVVEQDRQSQVDENDYEHIDTYLEDEVYEDVVSNEEAEKAASELFPLLEQLKPLKEKLEAFPFKVQWLHFGKVRENNALEGLRGYVKTIFKKELTTQSTSIPLYKLKTNNAAKKLHSALITLDGLERELETLLPSEGLGASVDELKAHFIKNPKAFLAYRALESNLKKGVQGANEAREYLNRLNLPKITSGAKAIAKQSRAKNTDVSKETKSIEAKLSAAKAASKKTWGKTTFPPERSLPWKKPLRAMRPGDTDFQLKLENFLLQQNVKKGERRDLKLCVANYITNRNPAELEASLEEHPSFESFRQHVEARKDLEVLVDILLYLKDETNEETFKAELSKCLNLENKVEREALLSFIWEKRAGEKDFRTYNSYDELYEEFEEQKAPEVLTTIVENLRGATTVTPEALGKLREFIQWRFIGLATEKQEALEYYIVNKADNIEDSKDFLTKYSTSWEFHDSVNAHHKEPKVDQFEASMLKMVECKDTPDFDTQLEKVFTTYYSNVYDKKNNTLALRYYLKNRSLEQLKLDLNTIRERKDSKKFGIHEGFRVYVSGRRTLETAFYLLQNSKHKLGSLISYEMYGKPMYKNTGRIVRYIEKNYQGKNAGEILKFGNLTALIKHVNECVELEKTTEWEKLVSSLEKSSTENVRYFVDVETYGTPMHKNIDHIVSYIEENYKGENTKALSEFGNLTALLKHVNECVELEKLVSSLKENKIDDVHRLVNDMYGKPVPEIADYVLKNYQGGKAGEILKFGNLITLLNHVNERVEVEELVSSLQKGRTEGLHELVSHFFKDPLRKIEKYIKENYLNDKAEVLLKFENLKALFTHVNEEIKKESSKKAKENNGTVFIVDIDKFCEDMTGQGKAKKRKSSKNKKRRGSNAKAGAKQTTGGSDNGKRKNRSKNGNLL